MSTTNQSTPAVKPKLILKTATGKILYLKSKPVAKPSAKALAIAKLIAEAQAYEHEGFCWAKGSQEWWAEKLGFSVATFRRVISEAPFVRDRIIDFETGKQVTLVRIGKPGQKTKRHLQNIMSAIWRKKVGQRLPNKCFGHLAGLVDHWGHDKAVDIFKLVVNEWQGFMAGVHIEIAQLGDDGKKHYFKYPSTSVMLRFWAVGVELHLIHQQAKSADKKDADYGVSIPF
ncbi:hypothetical protein HFO15_11275 [Rhizobium laguerreae]|uniref:hypothetical protein n=1 Tax=Rhizobium laguerreae TaxID=1076926 RepID=UPI0014425C38|nr:hypothetical protein [Rhizobium laguerreae]MBY3262229.1 hypothetical protein [Rhizobium laguerreae]MBY3338735.1 hypothetical protein [Rhizobium laguerreae]NKM16992.1 hypothetical protein [Rhizobium laguerreae]